jgi:beta-glucosidase
MCSYNKVNGIYSCENPETLASDLKGQLGFQGWVMSDWGATHSSSIVEGLDQEMPGQEFFGDSLLTMVKNGTVSQAYVDDSVLRILTPMFALGLFDVTNDNLVSNDVRSEEHVATARTIAAAAHVLLKNDRDTLPLPQQVELGADQKPFKIALIGAGVHSPITGGGGSGSVFPSYVSTPFEAILNKLGIQNPSPLSFNCSTGDDLLVDVAIAQWGCESAPSSSVEECADLCGNYVLCSYFTFNGRL